MSTQIDRIYELAEPYWQTRSNEIHIPESYELARRLLAEFPDADPEIVLPAILLHDIGYIAVPVDDQLKGLAGAPVGWDPELTRVHEIEGARLAGEILGSIDFDPERTRIVVEIVDGHDSRLEALSLEDALVKDADKLWRFTPSGVQTCSEWMDRTPDEIRASFGSKIDDWMHTEQAKRMAQELLDEQRA